MNLAGTRFRAVSNTKNGILNTETEMHFISDNGIVIGNYSGGTIVAGHVLARHLSESELEMLYHGATVHGDVRAGKAHATFSLDRDNHVCMHLDWQWLTGDQSSGHSEWRMVVASACAATA